MEMIVFLFFLFVLFMLLAPADPRLGTEKKPGCPPHKWKNVEIKDETGKIVLNKLVCERCGPPQYTARKNESI